MAQPDNILQADSGISQERNVFGDGILALFFVESCGPLEEKRPGHIKIDVLRDQRERVCVFCTLLLLSRKEPSSTFRETRKES